MPPGTAPVTRRAGRRDARTRADEPFVNAMLADLGNPFELALDVPTKRRLVACSPTRNGGMCAQSSTYFRLGHTHFVNLVEPTSPPADESWVLGEGEIWASRLG